VGITKCRVCNRSNVKAEHGIGTGQTSYVCERCGNFVLDAETFSMRDNSPDWKLIPYLSFYIRRNQGDATNPPHITNQNWKELALSEKSVTVPQKLEGLLRLIADRTEYPGQMIDINPEIDAALFNALNEEEVEYLFKTLRDIQWIDLFGNAIATVKVKGWEQIMPPASMGGTPGTCFVAMWFDASLDSIFDEAIEPAARACGFRASRIDRKLHNGDINDAILAEVKRSQFVIADFTAHRAGVYFEAGFARGLGRDVIWCCRADEFNKSHFDTNHYSHVVWKDVADFKAQLTARILATIPNARANSR
jgi:hypothetical protein